MDQETPSRAMDQRIEGYDQALEILFSWTQTRDDFRRHDGFEPESILRKVLEIGEPEHQRMVLQLGDALLDQPPVKLIPQVYKLTAHPALSHDAIDFLSRIPTHRLRAPLLDLVLDNVELPEIASDPEFWKSTATLFEQLGMYDELRRAAMLALVSEIPEVKEIGRSIVRNKL